MTPQSELHRAFAERFHAGKRIRPATVAQLADAEAALGVLWPESYRQFALVYGAVYTPGLLDLIVERKPGFGDVQQFLTPKQSVTETRRWRLEPDGGCAAFAYDSSGSFFAFRQLTATEPRPEDAPVWLFDHDAGEVVQQAASFDEWLGQFLQL
ncbi:MAG: SMI1/KNR4 family protein [Planctomycetales bacterium]|nr:SMI1/KNR4 family protein [Planctomycetales bacterium]